MRNNVLAKLIDDTYKGVNITALQNVHISRIKVLDLITKGDGHNENVEKYTGNAVVDLTDFGDGNEHVRIDTITSSNGECKHEETVEEALENTDSTIVEDE